MRDSQSGRYISKVKKIKAKKERPQTLQNCTKQDLLRRIQEVMTRGFGKIPDDVISNNWTWEKFKMWLFKPFWSLDYMEYDDSNEI